MEIVILPFMLPLLLLGSIVSRMGERRFDAMREAAAREAWRVTWARYLGRAP